MANEISREALISYLENLRTLETIIYVSDKNINELNKILQDDETKTKNKINELENRLESISNEYPPEQPQMPYEPMKPSGGASAALSISFAFWGAAVGYLFFHTDTFQISDLIKVAILAMIAFSVGLMWGLILDVKAKNKYNKAMEDFKQQKRQIMQEYQRETEGFQNWQKTEISKISSRKEAAVLKLQKTTKQVKALKNKVETEKSNINYSLQKAYSANIIPAQFRNIDGIYYLYDYISTSYESLTSALTQANLEAIKCSLRDVIRLQGEQIVLHEKQLEEQRWNNQEMLKAAQRTEENSRIAAQYQEIAALNSETTAQLAKEQLAWQEASYYVQRKQLAWQEADYRAKQLGLY